MTTEEKNRPDQLITVVHRSSRVRTHTKYYTPIMAGNCYAYAAAKIEEQQVLHPYVFFNHGSVQNEPDVTKVIMT